MSASTDRRVARLVGRIAEERAARGRPAISHAPRIARSFSGVVFEPPEVQGGEAEMLNAVVDIGGRWQTIDATRKVRKVTRREELIVLGPYSTTTVQFDEDTQDSRVGITIKRSGPEGGIDYMNAASDDIGSILKRPLSETKKPDEKDISLVDRVFAGWR